MSLKPSRVALVLTVLAASAAVVGANARPVAPAARATANPVRYVVATRGNEARYYVREQLARISFPSDAIGVTRDVTGGIAFDAKGQLIPAESKFVVDLKSLKSDRDMRDGFIQRRTLQTDQFPTVELSPTAIEGVSFPFPTSGEGSFKLMGNLTVRGVTHPTVWNVQARFDSTGVRGVAVTGFTFADFGLDKPRVMSVLTVADSIHLEYDFNLVAAGTAKD